MAKNQDKFTLSVLSEQGVIYYGECSVLFAPGERDTIAILPQHTPMIMKLAAGPISMKLDRTESTITELKTGVLYVAEEEVFVLANL